MSRLRPTTLTAGLCTVALGTWMVLHGVGAVGMSLAAITPALVATAGLVLLVSGLTRHE